MGGRRLVGRPSIDDLMVEAGTQLATELGSRRVSKAGTDEAKRMVLRRFFNRVDPDGTLPIEERERLARQAQAEHMARLRSASHEARRANREARLAKEGCSHE